MTLNRHLLVDDLTYLKLAVLDTADLAIAHNSDALLILRFPAAEMERFRLGILAFQLKDYGCATEACEKSGGEAGDTENS